MIAFMEAEVEPGEPASSDRTLHGLRVEGYWSPNRTLQGGSRLVGFGFRFWNSLSTLARTCPSLDIEPFQTSSCHLLELKSWI